MVNRREFFGIALGAGATLSLTPELLRAVRQAGGTLLQRAIPSSGEMLPVVGLSFSNHAGCADPAALKEVLKTFADNGGTVYDAQHGNAAAEQLHAAFANELGIRNRLFWSTRGTPPGPAQLGPDSVKTHVETLLARLKVPRLDLVMLPPQGDPMHLAALKAEKAAGRVRYIGVQVIGDPVYPQLESVMRSEPIDFIGVDYDVGNRARVEDTILPLALERKIGVMAFFPFGNAGGVSCTPSGTSLFTRVANRPLPEWAAEFDARTWAQFFIKYVISHPAVTVARVGTTKATHMLDNIGGGIGRLPDEATRRRMAELIDSFPPATLAAPPQAGHGPPGSLVLPAAVLDRYVGEYRTSGGVILNFRRYGTMLVAKVGSNPDTVVYGRSETRFQLGPNFVEFQLDSTGRATGLIYEQGSQKAQASRIR
ncbi:MAG TPA: aldo/keto reductase [Longimicrobium sp.]|jgi:aryl-alcohol dehydrogenase-like predicted oxidoreductase|uniref:aldo/keto reductase n=1 Tax=Longimicrobium sp. TaxID=2029185 RepID=UPI002ED9C2F4